MYICIYKRMYPFTYNVWHNMCTYVCILLPMSSLWYLINKNTLRLRLHVNKKFNSE